MRTITLPKGIQASGKTSWTMDQLFKYPGKYKRISRDHLRVMFDNGRQSVQNEKFIDSARDILVEQALIEGYHSGTTRK